MGDLVAFLGVAALVIVTPGQDTALTVRNALLGGRRGGVFTALGVVTGQATWALAASVGWLPSWRHRSPRSRLSRSGAAPISPTSAHRL
jgi:threonine/homoserine/homoserine lactone efflux protein